MTPPSPLRPGAGRPACRSGCGGGYAQVAFDVLGAAEAEGPVGLGVLDVSDEDVLPGHTLLRQRSGDRGVELLLDRGRTPGLREDLDHYGAVAALEAQAGVLRDDPARLVLGDDLKAVTFGNGQHVH